VNKIIGCIATKNRDFKPRGNSKVKKCTCCKTLVWLSAEEENFANTQGREVWCSDCVSTKAAPDDDIIGQKTKAYVAESFPESETSKKEKTANADILAQADNHIPGICTAAMQHLNPMADDSQMMLCQIYRSFVESRLNAMVEGRNMSLGEVLQEKYSQQEAAIISTFLTGMQQVGVKRAEPRVKRPSWFSESKDSIIKNKHENVPGFSEWTVEEEK
jgi:hypothetical protein